MSEDHQVNPQGTLGSPDNHRNPARRKAGKRVGGRNVKVAIGVGVGLGALVIICLVFAPVSWYTLVAVAVGLATWEVGTRLNESGYENPVILLIVGGQAMVWCSWPYGLPGLVGAFVATVLVILVARLFKTGSSDRPHSYLSDISTSIFVLIWIPLCASFAAMISLIEHNGHSGGWYVFTLMLCVVASDTGGYTTGVLFGSHPMAPVVSPQKTWEGFAGSVTAAAIMGTLCITLILDQEWWLGILLGGLLAVCATLGDLVESQFKRDLGIKDMSHMIPGHGGLMDRLDGMLPAATVTWLILSVVA